MYFPENKRILTRMLIIIHTPLVECGLGRGLVDHVLRGEVDVIASPHGVQEARLVHLHVLRGQDRQQGLKDGQIDRKIYRYKIDR